MIFSFHGTHTKNGWEVYWNTGLFINTGNGFSEKSVHGAADTIIRLGYKEIMYDISGDEVCFYINAIEAANPHGVTGQSHSRKYVPHLKRLLQFLICSLLIMIF